MKIKINKTIILLALAILVFTASANSQSDTDRMPAVVYDVYVLENKLEAAKSNSERKAILAEFEEKIFELKEQGHYGDLERVYGLLIENTKSKKQKFEYYMNLGEVFEMAENYPSSLEAYEHARGLYKKNEKVNIKIGEILLKSNLLNLAEESFLNVLNSNKNSENAKKRLGDINFLQNNFTAALEYYNSLESDFEQKDKIIKSAIVRRELNDTREAIRILEVYLQEVDSKDVDVLFLLGKIFIYERIYDSAEKVFFAFIEIDENNFIPYLYLASIYEIEKKFEKAAQYINKAAKLNSDLAVIDLMNARIAYKMNRLSQAKQYAKTSYSKAKTSFVKEQAKRLSDHLNLK